MFAGASSVRTTEVRDQATNRDNSGYLPMDYFRAMNSMPKIGPDCENHHYQTPSFPRPVSTFKSFASFGSIAASPSKPPPPLPSTSPPFSARPATQNIRSTLVPVKPPQVPTWFEQNPPAAIKTVTKIKTANASCNVCRGYKTSEDITSTVRDEVKKALDELSELISSTTEDVFQTSTDASSLLPPPPPPSSQPPLLPTYTSGLGPSSSFVPGYVKPISNEWEDINRKLNVLVINVRAQNKKIDDIRRVCAANADYVTFDELEELMTPSSSTTPDFDSDIALSKPPEKRSTLPYGFCMNSETRNGRSWGRKLMSCVKFGKKNK